MMRSLATVAAGTPAWPNQDGGVDAAWILLVIAVAFMVGIATTFAVILIREKRRTSGKQ